MKLELHKLVPFFHKHSWETLSTTTKCYASGKNKDKPFEQTHRRRCKKCGFILRIVFKVDHSVMPPKLDWNVDEQPEGCVKEMVIN